METGTEALEAPGTGAVLEAGTVGGPVLGVEDGGVRTSSGGVEELEPGKRAPD